MNQPWSPEKLISDLKAAEIIEKQFPKLKPVTTEILGEGFDNSVFLVNKQFVFRFPRREIAAKLMQTENRALPALAPLLPIPAPNPLFIGKPEAEYPWQFGGYEILPGKTAAALTHEQRMLSVEPLAHFLRTLHDFPLEEAKKLQIPYDQLDRINILKRKPMLETNIESARENGLLNQNLVESLYTFLATITEPIKERTQTLVHGDLHIRNFLVNETGRISAIIDWGDMHIGNPAIDLSIIYSFLPASGREHFFKLYGDVEPEVKKLARFKAVYSILVLLLYAEDLKDEELIKEAQLSLHVALSD
ncbi:phosphotransferase [Neobacillus mesonae]|nr:phosphotransferase [Neobacillus mesonae]